MALRADRHAGYHPHMTDLLTDTRVIDAEAPQYNATLVRREDMTESLAYFWVRFDGDPTPFEAGQYMTIGVMVDGKHRPAAVFRRVATGGRRLRWLRVLRPTGQRRDVHAAPVAYADRPGDADDRAEGQVHAPAR